MSSAAEFLPDSRALKTLEQAAEGCRGCELYIKWRPQGKRRLHQTPRAGEIEACKPWLQAEVAAVTVHPSAILRLRDRGEREAELAGFVADLEAVSAALPGAAK